MSELTQLRAQVETLFRTFELLNAKLSGNGKPGLIADVSELRHQNESIQKDLGDLKEMFREKIASLSGDVPNTLEIEKVSLRIVREFWAEKEAIRREEDAVKEKARKDEEDRKLKGPGSWFETRDMIKTVITSVIIALIMFLLKEF